MRFSLQAKVSIFIALIIIGISAASTYLFISEQQKSIERKLISRGTALSDALSMAAEEGLVAENLDLIKKAAYVVRRKDVMLVQVYSTIWEAIDAYPVERLKDSPDLDAIRYFKEGDTIFYKKVNSRYDFYMPILYSYSEDSPAITIGYVRLILSSAEMEGELRGIVISNIFAAAAIALLVIVALNVLISRLVVKPVMRLYNSVSMYKNGVLPDAVPVRSEDEIGELSEEFNKMSHAVKEKTEKLIDSEKRIRSLFERVEHAIFRLNKDGDIIEYNTRFNDMFGPITGICALLMSKKNGTDCLAQAIAGKMVQVEEKVMGKHGNELMVLLSLYPDTDSEGNIIGYDGYIIDVTEKRKLESNLLQAQKMEAIGTLAGGIAHDFNNLLSAILGYSSFIKEQIEESHPHYRYWDIIEQAALRGTELTNHLLAFARRKTEFSLKETMDINELIAEILTLLNRTFTKAITISTKFSGERFYVQGDPTALYQAILNICINARDAMPKGGRLTIETLGFQATERFLVGHYEAKAGAYIQVNITDNGVGMDKKTVAKIFEPFFTTKEFGSGTGLGLAIAYNVIKEHHGFIDVYSELEKGTTFKIYLPAYEGRESIIRKEEPLNLDADVPGRTILVVDDEEPLRRLCKEILESAKYSVLIASDGFEAVRILEEKREKISLVILDIIMPGISGHETFRKLKAVDPSVKVLISSGFSKEIGIPWADVKSIVGFIQKPYRSQALLKKVKEILSFSKK